MTIFGIIWLLIILIAFCYKDMKPMIYVTVIGMIWQSTNMIDTEKISCGPQLITSIFFIIKSIMYMKISTKINLKNILFSWFPLGTYILITFFSNNENLVMSKVLNVLIIIIYMVTFHQLKKFSSSMDKNSFEKIIVNLTIILLLIGGIQILINIFHLPKDNIIKTLFFNDVSDGDTYYYLNSTRFYSTFMEPSYVAGIMVGLFMYFFIKEDKKNSDFVLIFFTFIAILLTYSSTAYGALAIVLSLYFLKNITKKKTWIYIILAIIIIIMIALTTNILDKVIFQKGQTASARVRAQWNTRALKAFLNSPTFGNGYKSLRASSLFFSLLGELGIVGLVLYMLPILNISKRIYMANASIQLKSGAYIVIAMSISQMIACPDLDLCSFWLSMYIYAIVPQNQSNKKEENNFEKNRDSYISQST